MSWIREPSKICGRCVPDLLLKVLDIWLVESPNLLSQIPAIGDQIRLPGAAARSFVEEQCRQFGGPPPGATLPADGAESATRIHTSYKIYWPRLRVSL